MFTNLLVELRLDEVRVPKIGAQYSNALPVRGQIVVAPPCVIRFTICVEVFAVGWTILASVPNLSFPLVHAYPGVLPKLKFHRFLHGTNALGDW